MFARIALALPLGAATACALLYLMQYMIATGEVGLTEPVARTVDFVRIERSETVQVEDRKPDLPPAPAPLPQLALLDAGRQATADIDIAISLPGIDLSTEIRASRFESHDGEYLPMYKAAPQYPMRALQRKLEGYVIVEFVVTTSGAVRNVEIVESSSPIFEQAAVEAAEKFKYKPRVVDGSPIEVSGVQNRITFKLNA